MLFIPKAFAQTPICPMNMPALCNQPADGGNLTGKLIAGIIGLLLTIASIWAFIQFLISGVMWISSGGDKTHLEELRNRLFNAVIGLIICFGSWAVFIVILRFLGIGSAGPGGISLPVIKIW